MILADRSHAERVLARVAEQVQGLATPPVLLTVLVGGDEREKRFIQLKKVACERVGIVWRGVFLPAEATQAELDRACEGDADGIFVQLPLPAHLTPPPIPAARDIDGMLDHADFEPCTAAGALRVLRAHGVPFTRVRQRGARHYAADDIARLLDAAEGDDIVILASGQPVPASELATGATVIDLTGDLTGDPSHLGLVIPPRGCLGPLTIALLLENTLQARLRSCTPPT